MKMIDEKIERLAHLNAISTIIELDVELKEERESLHYELLELNVTKITNPQVSEWGFHFIGPSAARNKILYLDTFYKF